MNELLRQTVAYASLTGDRAQNKLSHAYMLYFPDRYNLRAALKFFALALFGTDGKERTGKLILSEGFSDLKVYPTEGKKLTADDAGSIVEDAALLPLEGDKKLYIISGFESASPIFQNKLLKILEEPPEGVYFLLGATTLAPVLTTVLSRVKLLEIPPFTARQIKDALDRQKPSPENLRAAEACGGILGEAQNVLSGGWYEGVRAAAEEITRAADVKSAVSAALKHGETKYKTELLSEMQRAYFAELEKSVGGAVTALTKPALIFALESLPGAFADVKFNANFPSLLYDFALRVATENEKWKKL